MGIEIRAAKPEERPAVCKLIDMAFDAEDYGPSLNNPCLSVGNAHMDPHDRAENTRILLADGEIVSVVHVAQREAYTCGSRAPFGVIAMIATHPAHRGHGYMRRLMADTESYMQNRGFSYALLLGAFRYYAPLGWRPCGEKRNTLPWKYVVANHDRTASTFSARFADENDIPFLSCAYAASCETLFGPVVRSEEYWRRWLLQCHWEGRYVAVYDGPSPAAYFHCGADSQTVDEIGRLSESDEHAEQALLAAVNWTAQQGSLTAGFWIRESDTPLKNALRNIFGEIPPTYCKPNGQTAHTNDPRPYLPDNWPEGMGLLTKSFNKGPGILASINNTCDLTTAMAQFSWTWFDADTM